MEQIKAILEKLTTLIKDALDDRHQKHIQQKEAQKQAAIHAIGTMMFNEIQQELFAVFQDAQYSYLKPVHIPAHIRKDHFIVRNNAYIFYYQLDANYVPARSVLSMEIQKYNADVYQFMCDLSTYYGYVWACQMYPYIMNGMQVMSADPFPTSIRIGVSIPVPQHLSSHNSNSNSQKASGNLYSNGGEYHYDPSPTA